MPEIVKPYLSPDALRALDTLHATVRLRDQVLARLVDHDLGQLVPAALEAAAAVEKLPALKGADKLALVQTLLLEGLGGVDDAYAATVADFVRDTLPIVMSAAVSVSKGQFDLGQAAVALVAGGKACGCF